MQVYEIDVFVSNQSESFFRYDFVRSEEAVSLSEDIRVLLYQSIRELIINITKYAQATEVNVIFIAVIPCDHAEVLLTLSLRYAKFRHTRSNRIFIISDMKGIEITKKD